MWKIVIQWCFAGLVLLLGCKGMDSTYKEFVVPGGLTYVGKPVHPVAYMGKYRVQLKWARGSDPNVASTRIYWNNYTDSTEVPVEPGVDSLQVMITGLQEQSYSFFLKAFDDNGNSSVPVEVTARVFGDAYEGGLLNRGLNGSEIDADGIVTLNWAQANLTAGAYMTEVTYTARDGAQKVTAFPATENESVIPDFETGEPLRFRTVYVPDTFAIDTFYTEYDYARDFLLKKTNWKIVSFSTEHPGATNAVANFIDGTAGTRWHSQVNVGSKYPHHATIDMGSEQFVTQFGVWRTTFENGGDDRAPDRIQFLVSNDNKTWTDLGSYDFNRFVNGEQLYPVEEAPLARYVKFVGLSGPQEYIVMGEIDVYVK